MTIFFVPSAMPGAHQYRADAPTLPYFHGWRRGIGLFAFCILLACQGCGTTPTSEEAAAAANTTAPANAPASASGASFTLLIDGESHPVQEATLVMVSAEGGFTMDFDSELVGVQIFGGSKAPLAVAKYPITDTASAVLITGNLPSKGSKKKVDPEESKDFFAPFIASAPAGTPLGSTLIYDWGEGLQELRGRPLGQLVFTRVGDSTADGEFQSRVYRLVTTKIIEHQGQARGLLKLEEHTVKAVFKNMPFENYEKVMGDLQKALKGFQ